MPSSLQAVRIRNAISPRFAIRTFLNIMMLGSNAVPVRSLLLFLARADAEERLAILDRATVLDENTHDLARHIRFDLIHQLHGFDDSEHSALVHIGTDLHEWIGAGTGRSVKGS